MPKTHVSIRLCPVRHLIGRRCKYNRKTVLAEGAQQVLYGGNNLLVDVVARERIAWPRPCICKINIDERGLASEPDAALKPSLAVNPCGFSKGSFQGLCEIVHDTISSELREKGRTALIGLETGPPPRCTANLGRAAMISKLVFLFLIRAVSRPRRTSLSNLLRFQK